MLQRQQIPQKQQLQNPKRIYATGINPITVIYTVPRGRIFKGTCYSEESDYSTILILNGNLIKRMYNSYLLYPHNNGQLELFEGDTIAFSNNYAFLLGVEYDA